MTFVDVEPLSPPDPQDVRCPLCGRVLHALRQPRCNWCGAPIAAEAYAALSAQSQHVMALPDPAPLPSVTSYAQQAEFRWNRRLLSNDFLPFAVQSFRPVTPGQSRLRVIVVALFGVLAGARLCYLLYTWWELHRMIQMLPH
jgi:hypothetical protein